MNADEDVGATAYHVSSRGEWMQTECEGHQTLEIHAQNVCFDSKMIPSSSQLGDVFRP